MARLEKDGTLRCCGRKAQLYKSKGIYYCHKCNYEYALDGKNLGYFGSGGNEAQYIAEAKAWAAKYAPRPAGA